VTEESTMSAYRVARSLWSTLLPVRVRNALWSAMPRPARKLKIAAVRSLARGADHDEIYDREYYERLVDPTMADSCSAMAASIMRDLDPRRVIDVGCGTGLLLMALRDAGAAATGLELSDAALSICRSRGLDVRTFDIERDSPPAVDADVVISTEVAEHLPSSCADRFVDLLCALAPRIVLTAAEPSIGSTDHVNEQPTSYWIERFAARGRRLDESLTAKWRDEWRRRRVAPCFHATVMVFTPAASADEL